MLYEVITALPCEEHIVVDLEAFAGIAPETIIARKPEERVSYNFV